MLAPAIAELEGEKMILESINDSASTLLAYEKEGTDTRPLPIFSTSSAIMPAKAPTHYHRGRKGHATSGQLWVVAVGGGDVRAPFVFDPKN